MLRQARLDKKLNNINKLIQNKINFVRKNNDCHLILNNNIHYWPSTDYWKDLKTGDLFFGVENLIYYLKFKRTKNIEGRN